MVVVNVVPEAVAGNVVVLDGLLLIQDQCRGVVVGLPHLEDEGLAHPLVRIKAEAGVNLNTIFLPLCIINIPCFDYSTVQKVSTFEKHARDKH